MAEIKNVSTENIYRLDGRVPILKAIPFGLQHILAMFVSNLTPITIIGAASGLDNAQIAILLQNAMFIAGIATLIQLYPLWRIGSRLPIVMGVSFTFVTILSYVGSTYGYETMVGAVLVGGFVEGTLGLLAKYWKKIITPVVAASVVTAIGYSLFTVWRRIYTRVWFGTESSSGFHYAGNLSGIQYPGKRILETAFGSGRSGCGIPVCDDDGCHRPVPDLFWRTFLFAAPFPIRSKV